MMTERERTWHPVTTYRSLPDERETARQETLAAMTTPEALEAAVTALFAGGDLLLERWQLSNGKRRSDGYAPRLYPEQAKEAIEAAYRVATQEGERE